MLFKGMDKKFSDLTSDCERAIHNIENPDDRKSMASMSRRAYISKTKEDVEQSTGVEDLDFIMIRMKEILGVK